jgi:hypothetical protein
MGAANTFAVAATALLMAACGGGGVEDPTVDENAPVVQGGAPSRADLAGIWLQVEDKSSLGVLVRFSPDGTFAMDDRGALATRPAARGTYKLGGDTITFTSGEGSDVCTEGDSWAWQTGLSEDGRLHVVHTDEAAGACRIPGETEWTLIRVAPRPDAAIREIPAPASGKGPPPTANELAGVWLQNEDSGLMVAFGRDRTFVVDNAGNIDTNPAVRGTYRVDGSTITFTIKGGHACASGDSWAWTGLLPDDGLLGLVHTKEATGNCRVPKGTEWTLIRVSPTSAAIADAVAGIALS